MRLRYTSSGYLVILPKDDPHRIVDAMLDTGYNEEFCVSPVFEPDFIARLMEAGFLVMSTEYAFKKTDAKTYILLPKLHLVRSVLFFENLHIKKTIKRHLSRYELRADSDFNYIVDRCVEIHGDGWLTPPLVDAIKSIYLNSSFPHSLANARASTVASSLRSSIKTIRENAAGDVKPANVRPVSFALYRNGKLIAGEFGIKTGRVYTSYSGYYDECNAGTVQLIHTTRYLQENGYAFFDLGMPMDYKTDLGAVDISPEEFVKHFRSAI